jgi:hypothetical protein
MNEGFWINSKTGKFVEMNEHAIWMSQPENGKKIGLSPKAIKKIFPLDPVNDRVEILTTAMSEGMIRVRGHGTFTSFEFTISTSDALWAIYKFGKKIGFAEFSGVYFANLRTKENYETTWGDFVGKLTGEGEEAVLRMARKTLPMNYRVRRVANGIMKQINE